ncbi:unnamed protein product [Lymnaea stagnalis]|uniref:GRAM domain-containing protein n=1 Tax=Lymnaea stagnalis TaxID=6523 RepID=A0AAV2IAR5_LYMST
MYEQEIDTAAPYDNVEFPVRKPGTGTWPGPAGTGSSTSVGSAGAKLYGHQTTGRVGAGSKLAPVVEVEGSEDSSSRLQVMSFGSTGQTPTVSYSQQSSNQGKVILQKHLSSNSSSSEVCLQTTTTAVSTGAESMSSAALSFSTTATGSTTTAVSSGGIGAKQAVVATTTTTGEKNNKPAIVVPNDSNTYIATQVTSSSDTQKKKTLKQVESEEEDFKRQDLNPGARTALERVYTHHPDFYQLNSKVLDEGSLLKQDVLDIYRKTGESLTYEQLLQGMLVDGERFLLGSCWLYFTHVQFLDVEGTKVLREPYGRGRVGLTSKRALFLSTETYTDANLEQFGDTTKRPDDLGYKLEVSKRSTVTFKNIPLSNFHSAEMEVVTGTAAQTKITKKIGCCTCFGLCPGRWISTPPMTRSINSRVLRVGVSMPPWQTRMFLDIHLDPSMSLTVARDFISQLHAFAPHMH